MKIHWFHDYKNDGWESWGDFTLSKEINEMLEDIKDDIINHLENK